MLKNTKNNQIKLLIVDDEEDLLELCTDAFEMEGHEVMGTVSPAEALELLKKHQFNAIISDARMPEMSGQEFLRRAYEIMGERLPAFFISTGAIDIDEAEMKKIGMTALIPKPFDIEEMVAQVVNGATELK